MTNFLILIVGLAGGYILRRAGKVPAEVPRTVNAWILHIAMPAVILQVVPHISWTPQVLWPLAAPVLALAGAGLFLVPLGKKLGWDRDQTTALVLTAGLANTSFVGFPLILAFDGPQGLPPAVLADQMSFLLLATAGITLAALARARRECSVPGQEQAVGSRSGVGRLVLGRVLSFPPLLTFPVALFWPQEWGLAELQPLFAALSATLAPLALFSVGVQIRFTEIRRGGAGLALALVYKLALAPLVILGLTLLAGGTGHPGKIAVFEMAMAPMITTAVVASEFGTAPRLATAVVGLGIPVSLVTTALWWAALGFLFP